MKDREGFWMGIVASLRGIYGTDARCERESTAGEAEAIDNAISDNSPYQGAKASISRMKESASRLSRVAHPVMSIDEALHQIAEGH